MIWRPLGVGGVAEQQVDSPVPQLGQPAHVRLQSVDGRVVDLVVAGVEDTHPPGLDHQRNRVGNRMSDADELEAEGTDLNRATLGVCLPELGRLQQAVLVELRLHEAEREPRRPHLRDRHLPKQIRQGADMILVSVREDNRANTAGALAQVREVRKDEIDAEVLVAREGEPGIDDQEVAVGLEGRHVLADLAEPSERDDSQCFRRHPRSLVGALTGLSPSHRSWESSLPFGSA
jgi:hypothetical protein